MKTIIYLIIALMICCFAFSCKTKTIYVPVKETEVVKEILRDTVVDVQLVPYKDSIATKDTISYLENKYAYSWAKWANGLLYHSLGIFDIKHPVDIKYIDREVIKEIEKPYPVEVVKEVNHLDNWQIILMCLGGVLICYAGFRIYKKIKV